jgi:predicted lipid-binding transport protein (Tim44 family)
VIFSISVAEEDVDDRSGQVLADDYDDTEHPWEERWRFARNPHVDTLVGGGRAAG